MQGRDASAQPAASEPAESVGSADAVAAMEYLQEEERALVVAGYGVRLERFVVYVNTLHALLRCHD